MSAGFKKEQTIDEMLEVMNNSGGKTETVHAGPVFINFKLQQELLESQKKYQGEHLKILKDILTSQNKNNNKQLFWSRILACATIALVLATILLVKFD